MRGLVFMFMLAACGDGDSQGILPDANGPCASGEQCGVEGSQCQIEGHAACNVDPTSGGCYCRSGAWECFTSCPAECPRLQKPTEGSACNLPPSIMCPYEDPPYGPNHVICTCTSTGFACN